MYLIKNLGKTKLGGDIMGEKHPDRTDEWSKQQQALKNMKTTISSKKTKDDKKDHQ